MTPVSIGEFDIYRIEETLGPDWDPRFLFPEFDEQEFKRSRAVMVPDHYDPASGNLILGIQSWLIHTPRHNILIDACVGNSKARPRVPVFDQLDTPYLDCLPQAGVTNGGIDYVLLSHLHVDHVGWCTTLCDGRWAPTFPNARHVFSRIEAKNWKPANGPLPILENENVWEDSIQLLIGANLVETFDGEWRFPDEDIVMRPVPRHSAGQCAVLARSQGRSLLFCADVLDSPIQVINADWNAHFDPDPQQSRATRHAVLKECVREGHILVPVHRARPHMARIARGDDGRYEPLLNALL